MFNVLAYLLGAFPAPTGAPAYLFPPEHRPAKFITVERTGGESGLGRDMPSLAVQCWADTEADAYALAIDVKNFLIDLPIKTDDVYKVDVTSIYSFPDPDSDKRRYQVSAQLVTRPD